MSVNYKFASKAPAIGGKVSGPTKKATAPMKTPTKQMATKANSQPNKSQSVKIQSPIIGKKK